MCQASETHDSIGPAWAVPGVVGWLGAVWVCSISGALAWCGGWRGRALPRVGPRRRKVWRLPCGESHGRFRCCRSSRMVTSDAASPYGLVGSAFWAEIAGVFDDGDEAFPAAAE